MKNYHQYEKQKQREAFNDSANKKKIKFDKCQNKKDENMIKNYWKRVENFMIQMVENPIHCDEFEKGSINDHKFREENPKKFLGNAIFIIKGFKDEKQRINESIASFKRLEIQNDIKSHEFRDRNANKEIQPEMKFGLQNFGGKGMKKGQDFQPSIYSKDDQNAWNNNRYNKGHNKDQFELNHKTHFKGLETYYNKLTDGKSPGNENKPKDKSQGGGNFDQNDEDDPVGAGGQNNEGSDNYNNKGDVDSKDNGSDIDENELKKQAVHDFKDSYEMSKLALQKCNKLPGNNSEFLRSGDGHFVSMPHTNIKNSYHRVFYNDDISTTSNNKGWY